MNGTKQTIEMEQENAAVVEANTQKALTEQNVSEKTVSKYAKFAGKTKSQLAGNQTFNVMAMADMIEAGGELPTKKYLEQKSEGVVSNDVYVKFVDSVYSPEEEIPVGEGAEYMLYNNQTTNLLDENAFVPADRNDIENYLYVDSIDIPTDIKQVKITVALWKYFQYFLSGKVEVVAQMAKEATDASLKLKANFDRIALIKNIFRSVYADASSTEAAPTRHLVGDKNKNIVDAVKEWLDFIYGAYSHNKQFAYKGEGKTFGGYNLASEQDFVHIVNYQTYNNIIKVATTFLAKDEFIKFSKVNNFVVLPKTIFNPTKDAGTIDSLESVLSATDNVRVKGAILSIDKRALKRVRNLESITGEFFPNNLTDVVWGNYRYGQGFLKWGQVAVYNNEALESPFEIPVKQITAPTNI